MTAFNVGDRVKFLGVDADAQDRKNQQITGVEGYWPNLKPGAIGTINEVVTEGGYDDNTRLFVVFEGCECPLDEFSRMLGMPVGWPVLRSEVEAA